MVPETLEGWTFDTVVGLCEAGLPEGETQDFKQDLPNPENLAKACCAFANTRGGYLILGISEDNPRKPIGIDRDREIYGDFMKRARTEPQVTVPMPRMLPIPGSERVLYVFHIPRSNQRPHTPSDADKRYFVKRVGSDCVRMTRDEVKAQMLDEEGTRQKLGLLLIELHNIAWSLEELSGPLGDPYEGTVISFETIDRITVEAYPLLMQMPRQIMVLSTLKRRLMRMDASTQRFFHATTEGYGVSAGPIESYKQQAAITLRAVLPIIEQIEKAVEEQFGVKRP